MPKPLSSKQVEKLMESGDYYVARNLWLQVRVAKAGTVSRSWIVRYRRQGRLVRMGIGRYPTVTYSKALEAAQRAQVQLSEGKDPRDVRDTQQRPRSITFEAAVEEFINAHQAGWSSPKHSHQVRASLETYALPVLKTRLAHTITTNDVVRVLDPIWVTKHETATRVRSRVEQVLSWCRAAGYASGDNPASWDILKHRLPPTSRVAKVEHHTAIPWREAPKVYKRLATVDSMASKLLRFIILTGVRYAEAAGAKASEFDLELAVWTLPADRAKVKREHRVPLSGEALAIVKSVWQERRLLFKGQSPGKPVSDTRLRTLLREQSKDIIADADTHGFRSTLRDWAAETGADHMTAEAALEHSLGTKVQTAYLRSDLFDQRVGLMDDWASFLLAH
jgi:integrase